MEKPHRPSLDSVLLKRVHKFQERTKLSAQLQIVSETLTFRIRHFMAQPRRADSQHRVFNAIEFLHPDIQTCTTFQTRDGSHASEIPLTSLMVCNSFKFVMDSVFLEFMCFPACGIVHFKRFTSESSRTDSNDPHQLGTRIS